MKVGEYEFEVLPDGMTVELNTNDDRYIYLTVHDLEELIESINDQAELIL